MFTIFFLQDLCDNILRLKIYSYLDTSNAKKLANKFHKF